MLWVLCFAGVLAALLGFRGASAEEGYFVSTHFRLDPDAMLLAGEGTRACLYPDYETMIPVGVCLQAVNPSTEATSYQYSVEHNYLPVNGSGSSANATYSSVYKNSTLYLQTYSDARCTNYTGSNYGPTTTFTTSTCQRPINDNNADYYNVIYQYVAGAYPPSARLPGPTVTLTGYLSQAACTAKFQVSTEVVLRDGACVVDPGQGAPLGNAEYRANSFIYTCRGGGSDGACSVQYFTDHACLHALMPSNTSLVMAPNLLSQDGAYMICQFRSWPFLL